MKKTVRQKLNSQRGASMMMALLYLLLALILGGVVVTAAQANAGRIRRDRQGQQDYLAVVSAARLAEREITGMTFTGKYDEVTVKTVTNKLEQYKGRSTGWKTITEGQIEEKAPTYPEKGILTTLTGAGAGHLLSQELQPDLAAAWAAYKTDKNIQPDPGTPAGSRLFTLTLEGPEGKNLPPVQAAVECITNDQDKENRLIFDITVRLWVDRDGAHSQQMELLFRAKSEEKRVDSQPVPDQVKEDKAPKNPRWPQDGEQRGGGSTTTTTTTTRTTTVTWSAPVMERGETVKKEGA